MPSVIIFIGPFRTQLVSELGHLGRAARNKPNNLLRVLKALLRTNVLNDITAAMFSVSFSQILAVKKTQKTVQL